jgi:hypothetical protein
MQIVFLLIITIFSATYLIVWISSFIKPYHPDGTKRDTFKEAGSISVKVFFLTVVVSIGFLVWLLASENNHEDTDFSHIAGKWRSDEVILNLQETGDFEWHSFAGREKNQKWNGSWKLDSGVLFLTFDSESTLNYLVRSINKNSLTLEFKDPEKNYSTYKYYFNKVN